MAENNKAKLDVQIGFYESQIETIDSILEKSYKRILEYEKRLANGQKGWSKKTLDAKRKEYNEILKARKKLSKEIDAVEKREEVERQARIHKEQNTYIAKFKKAFATLTRYAGAYTIINAVVQTFKMLAKELLVVEQNMARVSAISDATNKEMSDMKAIVFDVSAAYGKTASEVSAFTIEMAKLGKTAVEINGLADSAAQLSTILGEDMVTSGTLMVTTMNQYGLSVKEAGRITSTFFDVVAKSPADIRGLQTALQYVGVTARATGFSLEETGRMVAFLSRNGIKMSKIGTGMRNVLSKLARMGGNVKETMDELAKSGMSVDDAFSKFGIRGGNVALLLLRNWDEVKKLMNDAMPTAASNMLRSARAMSSWYTRWAKIKGVFVGIASGNFGALKGAGKMSDVQSLSNFLNAENISITEFNDSLSNLIKSGKTTEEIIKALKDQYNINGLEFAKLAQAGKASLVSTESSGVGLSIVVKETKKQADYAKKLDEARKLAASKFKSIIAGYKEDHVDMGKLINQIVTDKTGARKPLYNLVYEEFRKVLGDKEAEKQTREMFSFWQNEYDITVRDYKKLPQVIKQYQEAKQNVIDLISKAKLGKATKADVNEAITERDNFLKYLCILTNGAYGDCKKAKTISKSSVRSALKEIEDAYKISIAQARNAHVEALTELTRVSDVSINGEKKPLSFENFMIEAGFDPEKSSYRDEKEMLDKYEKAANDFITKLRVRIGSAADKLREAALKDYQTRSGIEAKAITDITGQLAKTKEGSMEYEMLLSAKKKHTANIIDLDTKYKKTTDNVTDSERKRIEELGKLIKQLDLFGKKTEKQIAREHAIAVKDDIMQIINSAAEIYNKFNQSMLQNTLDRLNAEKQAAEAHYNEQNDILKAQVDNKLITEAQYAKRRKNLEKKRIEDENKMNEAVFNAQKKADLENAIVNGIVATARAAMVEYSTKGLFGAATAPIVAALVAAQSAAEIAAISSRKFYPVKYEVGGWINGEPHVSGGVPFSIGGKTGFEAERDEFIVNKRSAAKNASLIESINNDEDFTKKLIKALSSAPIRAYFTDKDLDAAERNRLLKDNIANYMGS